MANFIPVLDVATKLQRKQFAEKYLCLQEKFWTKAAFVDEQRFS
jgi:hypothetical protein